MERRIFIGAIAGGLLAAPLAAEAQETEKVYRIGYLESGSRSRLRGLVVGQVALWGRVIELERGWRAQFAYPTRPYALSDDALLAHVLRER